jgi:hypothetical protein
MLKAVQWFVDRLVERFIPIVGSLFSASIESLHALGHAEQQSRLEDAARRYEADDKPEIAAVLRRRAADLASDNPAAQALRIYDNVAGGDQPLLERVNEPSKSDVARLPDFNARPSKPRRKKSSPSGSSAGNDE